MLNNITVTIILSYQKATNFGVFPMKSFLIDFQFRIT